jgi:hypothetical protein
MHRIVQHWGPGLAALLVACGGPASADQKSAGVSAAGVAWAPASSASSAEGGAAEVAPLTEEELRRLLDALEQEIGER